jgi:spore coat polysaccharide biosynthesis protein SpsF (cytidylyltransferase family)
LTVDTESDLRVARAIYENFEGKAPILENIIHWLDLNPEVIVNDIDLDSTTINEAVNYKLAVD